MKPKKLQSKALTQKMLERAVEKALRPSASLSVLLSVDDYILYEQIKLRDPKWELTVPLEVRIKAKELRIKKGQDR
jgi:hypothetical protein